MADKAVDRARAAVARAVKARNRSAEQRARGDLAAAVLRARVGRWIADGVTVDPAQALQLHALVDQLAGSPRRVTFEQRESI